MHTKYRAFSIVILLSLLLSAVCTPGLASAPAQTSGPQDPYEPEPARPLYGVAGVEAQTNLTPEAIEQLKAGQDEAEQPEVPAFIDYPSSVIAYQRYDLEYSNWDIYLSGDGGAGSRILNTQSNEIQPRLDRQSTKLTYLVPTSGHYAIYTLDFANNNRKTRLTFFDADAVYPCWSPDSTKSVFEGYQNGNQGEIYVMNADGSNITRLTFNGGDANTGYDGMPAWSPDGSSIAFVSKRTGGYRVWAMNADGSNPVQLSNQPYSAHPVWSGDGAWIGYDSDGNNNGWNEVWKMRSDGTEQQMVLVDSSIQDYYTEYYAGSFSPVGDTLISSEMQWRLIGSTNYLVSARIAVSWRGWIISGDYNMNPDWKTTDRVLPTVWITPLPAISPAPVPVNYGCNDAEAGIFFCKLMVREGPGGAWQIYDPANAPLLGGHSYTFRVDAMDKGGNVNARTNEYDTFTTIESSPPESWLLPLAPMINGGNLLLQWTGSDSYGSDIAEYYVQYQEAEIGAWEDVGTFPGNVKSTIFSGQSGMAYQFRITAKDAAGNIEAWDLNHIVSTKLIFRQVSGSVYDAWGVPLNGAESAYDLNPASSEHDPNGVYMDAFGSNSEIQPLSGSMIHPQYGSLPDTAFGINYNIHFDAYLPSLENSIINSNFENSTSLNGWSTGGTGTQPILDGKHFHSGSKSAYLGEALTFTANQLTSENGSSCGIVAASQNPSGKIHIIYSCDSSNKRYFYHRVFTGNSWSAPEEILSTTDYQLHTILFAPNGDIFIVHDHPNYYRQYVEGEGWKPAGLIQSYTPGTFAIDSLGQVHRILHESAIDGYVYRYSRMSRNGDWTNQEIVGYFNQWHYYLETDEFNHPVIIYYGDDYGQDTLIGQSPDGTWLAPIPTGLVWYEPFFHDNQNRLHLIAKKNDSNQLLYSAIWNPQSGTLSRQYLTTADNQCRYELMEDPYGNIHFVCIPEYSGYVQSVYSVKPSGAAFKKVIIPDSRTLYKGQFDLDSKGNLFAMVGIYAQGQELLKYSDDWMPYGMVYKACNEVASIAQMFIDSQDRIHLIGSTNECLQDMHNSGASFTTLSQIITVPAAEESPVLSFMYEPTRTSGPGSPFSVAVIDGSQTTTVFTPQVYRSGWQHAAVDMSPWGGRQVTIQFKVQENAGAERTGIYLDEVSLGPVYADVYAPSISRDAQPGSQVTFSVAYGNQGGAPANGTMLELTLPAELSYVSASVEPVETSPALKWNLGDLARGASGTFSLTLAVAASVPLGVELSAPLSVSTSRELQTWNNTASLMVFTGHRVYLPVTRK